MLKLIKRFFDNTFVSLVVVICSTIFLIACEGVEFSNALLWDQQEMWFTEYLSREQGKVTQMQEARMINNVLADGTKEYLMNQMTQTSGINVTRDKITGLIDSGEFDLAKAEGKVLAEKLGTIIRAIPMEPNMGLNPHGALSDTDGSGGHGVRIEMNVEVDASTATTDKNILKNGGANNLGLLNETQESVAGSIWGLTEEQVGDVNEFLKDAEIWVLNPEEQIDLLRVHNSAKLIFDANSEEDLLRIRDNEMYTSFKSHFVTTHRNLISFPAAYVSAPLLINDPEIHTEEAYFTLKGGTVGEYPKQPFFHLTEKAKYGNGTWSTDTLWSENDDLDVYKVPPMTEVQLAAATFADLPSEPWAAGQLGVGVGTLGAGDSQGFLFYDGDPEGAEAANLGPEYLLMFEGKAAAYGYENSSWYYGVQFTPRYRDAYLEQVPYRDLKVFGVQYVATRMPVYDVEGNCIGVEARFIAMPHLAAVVRTGSFNPAFLAAVGGATGTGGSVSLVKAPDEDIYYVLTYPVYVVDSISTDITSVGTQGFDQDFRVDFRASDMMIDLLNLKLSTMSMSAGVMSFGEKYTTLSNLGHIEDFKDFILNADSAYSLKRFAPEYRVDQIDRIKGVDGRAPTPVLDISSFTTVPPRAEVRLDALRTDEAFWYDSPRLIWLAYPEVTEIPTFMPKGGTPKNVLMERDSNTWNTSSIKSEIVLRNEYLALNTYGPRVVLRDYLEMFYMPGVVPGEDYITVGRLIRINRWWGGGDTVNSQSFASVLDSNYQETNIRFAPHNFLDQRSTQEAIRLYSASQANGDVSLIGQRNTLESPAVSAEETAENAALALAELEEARRQRMLDEDSGMATSSDATDSLEELEEEMSGIPKTAENELRNAWFGRIYPTIRFPGEYIAISDWGKNKNLYTAMFDESVSASGVTNQPVLYGMKVNMGPQVTGGMGWMSSFDEEKGSITWFNRWLSENGFIYRVNTNRLQAQFHTQFGLDIGLHSGLAGPDVTTLELMQDEIDLDNQLELVGWINAAFMIFGILLLAWATLLPLVWLMDVNMPFDFKFLKILTVGHWIAIDTPDDMDLPQGYVGIGVVVRSAIIVGIIGIVFLMLRPIGFFTWIIELLGGTVLDLYK